MPSLPTRPDVIPRQYADGPDGLVPVQLLLALHNGLIAHHPLRTTVAEYIVEYAKANAKAHWTRAIVKTTDGYLVFDEDLYDLAIYRGKQETRMASAEEAFRNLREQLEFFVEANASEAEAGIKALATKHDTLLPLPDRSNNAAAIVDNLPELQRLINLMQSGLANTLVGPANGEQGAALLPGLTDDRP